MIFDDEIIEYTKKIIKLATKTGDKIILAESCTGGIITAALTDISGSSQVIEGGFLTYSDALKKSALNVPEQIFINHGSVSKQTVYAMACGALKNSNATISLAVTGIAGPTGGTKNKPVGLVYICAIDKLGNKHEVNYELESLSRANFRNIVIKKALTLLIRTI